MKKKNLYLLALCLGIIFILTGCGSKAELTDYIEVNFDGYDTMGNASYSVNEDKLINDVFEISDDYLNLNMETLAEIDKMLSSFTITLDKESDLSNGDEIVVHIKLDKDKAEKIKSKDEMKVKVSGLEEPGKLSDEEIDKNVVVNFSGVSGRGEIQIDTTIDGDLTSLGLESKQDGEIKNGDMVEVALDEDSKNSLASLGYILTGKGSAKFEATGLAEVAEKPEDIANLEDIERLISEGINRQYADSSFGYYKYEIKKENTYYRQYVRDNDSSNWSSSAPSNGTLVNIYTIKEYDMDGALNDTFTAVFGYTDIILDENNQANVTEINEYFDTYDKTYSLESVKKLMEGYGYQQIK